MSKDEKQAGSAAKTCPLCGKTSDDWHNGAPVIDAQVCTECNKNVVIPARLFEPFNRDKI